MTERGQHFARLIAVLVGIAALHGSGTAWGQGLARDLSGSLTAGADQSKKTWLEERFGGSNVDFGTYVGSGTFYTSGHHNPYISNSILFIPSFRLATKYDLSLNARGYVEEEYTQPDTSNGRRFYTRDILLYLQAKNLYTMPRAKVKFGGTFRAALPVSWESRYAHLITSLGVGGSASRLFEFGRPDAQGKRWNLILSLGETFSKAFRTSAVRGNFPGDTSGCREVGTAGPSGGGGADTDHCGGPLSTSFTFITSGTVILIRGRYSLTTIVSVINDFKYSVAPSTWAGSIDTLNTIPMGRADSTWGIVAAGYDLTAHFTLSVGLASFQPALDSRYQNLRFPFFDFAGPNANNFTQAFVSLTGTL